MFWNKKKENEKVICNANVGLSECTSIQNLRNYQQRLNEIKGTTLESIIKKYFEIQFKEDFFSEFEQNKYEQLYVIKRKIEEIINPIFKENSLINFEERFQAFGKEIDTYINSSKLENKLLIKIKNEKEKLGII